MFYKGSGWMDGNYGIQTKSRAYNTVKSSQGPDEGQSCRIEFTD